MKIEGKDPGSFALLEEGKHVVRITRGDYKMPDNPSQGYIYQFWSKVEGGEQDGTQHFDSFFTKSQFGDGLDGCRNLLQFGVKAGVLPESMDSDEFETESFASKFTKKIQDRLVGIEIKHVKDKKDKDKMWARSAKYFSPKEQGKKAEAPKEKKTFLDDEE